MSIFKIKDLFRFPFCLLGSYFPQIIYIASESWRIMGEVNPIRQPVKVLLICICLSDNCLWCLGVIR